MKMTTSFFEAATNLGRMHSWQREGGISTMMTMKTMRDDDEAEEEVATAGKDLALRLKSPTCCY